MDVLYLTGMNPTNPYSFCIFPTKGVKRVERKDSTGFKSLLQTLKWILSVMLVSIHPHNVGQIFR